MRGRDMQSISSRRATRFVALALSMTLILAACGGGETTDEDAPAAAEGVEDVEGVEETGGSEEAAPDGDGPSGTLNIAWMWDPTTLDSQMHRQRYTQIISHQLRDKLYYQEPPGLDYEPLLAESAEQIDETTYEIKIREGVLFHNGDELTSEDVVFTFERLWDPATESPRATMGQMQEIESVEAVDRYTIRWNTTVPFGPVEQALIGFHVGAQEILHKATYEDLSIEEAHDFPPVGVGPFKFVEWIPEQRLVMEANLDYFQGPPGVEGITWQHIPEEATRTAELLAGSVDMIYPVTPDFVGELESAGMKIEAVPGTSMRMLMMNVREGSPFHDVEVRRAMNQAINVQEIVDTIYAGTAEPQTHVAFTGQEGHIEGYEPFPYDPDAAGEILSQVTEPIELFTESRWELAGEAIAETLRGYGMDVTAVVLEDASHVQVNEEGDFDLLLGGAGAGSGQFGGAYYNNQFSCLRLEQGALDRVRTGFCDQELEELMAEAESQADYDVRIEMIEDVVRALTEEHVPWVPLYNEAEVWAMQPYVEGFRGSTAGQMMDLWKVTLDN